MANDSASLFFSLILTSAELSAGSKPGSAHAKVMITFTGSQPLATVDGFDWLAEALRGVYTPPAHPQI